MKIRLFGMAVEIVGDNSILFDIPGNLTVKDFRKLLEVKYPELTSLGSYLVAVNNAYAASDTTISPGDEVAILPPVSGG